MDTINMDTKGLVIVIFEKDYPKNKKIIFKEKDNRSEKEMVSLIKKLPSQFEIENVLILILNKNSKQFHKYIIYKKATVNKTVNNIKKGKKENTFSFTLENLIKEGSNENLLSKYAEKYANLGFYLESSPIEHNIDRKGEVKQENKESITRKEVKIEGFKPIFEDKKITIENLTRHFLILGETGSGKTVSGIAHILSAALDLKDSSMLIVDPKQHELNEICKEVLKDDYVKKVINVNELNNEKISFFEGWEKEPITLKAEKLWQLHPVKPEDEKQNRYFFEKAKTFFFNLLKLVEALKGNGGDLNKIFQNIKNKSSYTTLNATNNSNLFDDFEELITNLRNEQFNWLSELRNELDNCKIDKNLYSWLTEITSSSSGPTLSSSYKQERMRQLSYDLDYLAQLLRVINDEKVKEIIDFSPFSSNKNRLSIKKSIMDKKIIIFSPDVSYSSEAQDLIGKTLKRKFFQFVFKTYDSDKNSDKRRFPVFYICDEFQRFITADTESGEQNFLDRCRAYVTCCVLATQSISSLINATKDQNMVEIILENTGNKLFFRSTSPSVKQRLLEILPAHTMGHSHIIQVRPPTTLKPGECYYLISDGSWGRVQLPKWEPKN